ncbi:MAG: hypothetical protein QOJ51_6631 [Acidobacteriaceae bacterium]|jgi:hypothetical protein|nr:hypothetical protein [Acidobacteriaceae bacterium]
MTRTDWMKTKSRQLLKYSSAAAMTGLVALAALGTPTAAVAQHIAEPQGLLGALCPQSQGPEGSWLYTVTIPGYTFQGIETYSAGGGYTEADQLSFSPASVASAGHGAWKSTGERTFLLTYLNLTFDAFSSGNPTGTLKVRQNTKLEAITPTTVWTAKPFPASVAPSPLRRHGFWCRHRSKFDETAGQR